MGLLGYRDYQEFFEFQMQPQYTDFWKSGCGFQVFYTAVGGGGGGGQRILKKIPILRSKLGV